MVDDKIQYEEYTILIVDDTPTNLGVIADYLEEYGFDIMTARDGETGLTRAKQGKPDLILLDIMMPDVDGFEVCRRLKEDEETREIPIIFMTALAGTKDKVKGFEIGAVDYVTKPINQEEVLARVTTHLKIRDLTRKLQTANDGLKDANEELTILNQQKDKFFSIMAHDLKGPFQPLLQVSKYCLTMAERLPAEEILKMSGIVYRSAQNVYALLENLLQWSRMQLGRIEFTPVKFFLHKSVYNITELLKSTAEGKDVALVNNVPEDTELLTDPNMLNAIIRNLVSNAVKYTPEGGSVTVETKSVETEEEKRYIQISVKDTGIGIEVKDISKLFKIDSIHTTPGTAKEKGTGMGLILCKEMVEKCGGTIGIESVVDEGTTVYFTIPAE